MKKLGKYELLGELGRGAFGVVYRAHDPVINRMVALKTMSTSVAGNPGLLERFYREAQSAGSLQHPNIVTIYDMGEEGGSPFIAMELVDGQNLDDIIASRKSLPLALKLMFGVQACRAFDYAHKRGIIHRDIKPGNVMVSKEGVVKVVDFGIARVVEGSNTQTGTLIGTFRYMAPEVFNGERANQRTDIWSFGVLLYELLSYERPFAGETAAALMGTICLQEPTPLRQTVPDCPEDLERVVQRMLRKQDADRYQTMEDLLDDLDPIAKRLQSGNLAELIRKAETLLESREFEEARNVLQQAAQVDASSLQVRALLEKIGVELRRVAMRPKAQEHVEKGRELLQKRKLHEAAAEAEGALQLDSHFEAAQELLSDVNRVIEQAQLAAGWLRDCRQRLVEGLPEEAEVLLAKIRESDPLNPELEVLQQQAADQRELRHHRVQLYWDMEQARSLWTQQKYTECVDLLKQLQQQFPGDGEVGHLLEAASDALAEQVRHEKLAEARTLLSGRQYEECVAVLKRLHEQFPAEEEITRLLQTAREEQADLARQERLTEARNLLAARRYKECVAILGKLQEEFRGSDTQIMRLLETARQDESEQTKRERLSDIRKLLSQRNYEDCTDTLRALQQEFPGDEEVQRSLDAVLHDQADYERKKKISEAREFVAAQKFSEALAILKSLLASTPDDTAVMKLLALVQHEQEKRARAATLSREWEVLKKLISEKSYDEAVTQGEKLLGDFPGEADLERLVDFARRQRAQSEREVRLRHSVEQVRQRLKSGQFAEAATAAQKALADFHENTELAALLQQAQARVKKESVRQLIEKRVHEIKFKINRGELSDAKKLAQETLLTVGPDTDVQQMLTFAEAEYDAKKMKERQDQKLETIRTLIQSGNLTEATAVLGEAMKSRGFDVLDPRAYTLAEEIETARKARAPTYPLPMADPGNQAREYAVPEGPPLESSGAARTQSVAQKLPSRDSSMESATPSTAGAFDLTRETLDRASRVLARYVGPLAGVLAKKAAKRADSLDAFYQLLAEHVDKASRQKFLRELALPDS